MGANTLFQSLLHRNSLFLSAGIYESAENEVVGTSADRDRLRLRFVQGKEVRCRKGGNEELGSRQESEGLGWSEKACSPHEARARKAIECTKAKRGNSEELNARSRFLVGGGESTSRCSAGRLRE